MNTPIKDSLQGIKGVLIFFGVVTLTIVLILAQKDIIHIFLLYFASILFAVLLDELTGYFNRLIPISRTVSIVIILFLLIGLLVLIGWFVGPVVVKQIALLIESIPKAVRSLQNILAQTPWGNQILQIVKPSTFLPLGMNILGSLEHVFTDSLKLLSELIFIILMGTFLTLSPRLYIDNALLLFRPKKREQIQMLIRSGSITLRKWFFGRLCAMALIGVLTFIGLRILGMQLAFVLGLFAGVFAIIPFLGAIISIIPAILVALSTNPIQALWVIFIFIGVHLVEDIAAPLIQQRITSVPPALLVSGQIFLTFVGGLFGLLLAEPLCITIIVATQILYVRGVLGESVQILGEKKERR